MEKLKLTKTGSVRSYVTCFILAGLLIMNADKGFSQCQPPSSVSSINGVTSACPGQTKTYSIGAVAGATSYTWTVPAGCSIYGLNPYTGSVTSVNVVFGATFSPPGNIVVTANNACGSSAPTSNTITASYPALSIISGSNKTCPGDNRSYHVSYLSGVTYTWTVPSNVTITSGQGAFVMDASFGTGFTSGIISVTGSYGCGNGSAQTLMITPNNPIFPTAIVGSIEACPNSSHVYSILPRIGETYNWNVPAGATITGQGTSSITVNFPSGFTLGTISVSSQNACGTSGARTLAVRANPVTPGTITGTTSGICNSSQTYTIAPVPTATYYTWTGPVGSTLVSGQGTTSATFSFPSSVSGYVKVKATNNCGTSADRSLSVTGNIIIRTQPQGLTACEDDTTTIAVVAPGSGLSFQWRKNFINLSDNADFSGTQTASLNILKVDSLNAGYFDVVITSSCAASVTSSQATLSVNMKPPASGAISRLDHACPGTSDVLFVPANGFNTTGYLWEAPLGGATFSNGQGTHTVTVDFGTTMYSGYSFAVRAVNGCGLSHNTTTQWIRKSISTPKIYGAPKVCPGETNFNYTGQYVAQTSNVWTATPGIIITSGQGTLSIMVDFSSTFNGGSIFLTSANACMTAPARKFDVHKAPGCRIGDENSLTTATDGIELSAFPNPAKDKINLVFNSNSSGPVKIKFTDVYGKTTFSEVRNSEVGENKILVNLDKISKGFYTVSIEATDKMFKSKIVIDK